jgi:hypothetical protein
MPRRGSRSNKLAIVLLSILVIPLAVVLLVAGIERQSPDGVLGALWSAISTEGGTLLALILIPFALLVGLLLAWLVVQRLLKPLRQSSGRCPRCGSDLRRIRRTRADRLLSIAVPVRRFRCSNEVCHWEGLRL